MKTITLTINKDELSELRKLDLGACLTARHCLALHRLRNGMIKSLSALNQVLGKRTTRKPLEDLGFLSVGDVFCPGGMNKRLTVVYSEGAYTFTSNDAEYSDLIRILELEKSNELKRIAKVQNLEGITIDLDKGILESDLVALKEERDTLDATNETEAKRIKKIKYQINSIENVLENNIKVHVYKKYNCKRLYSTLTSLPKEYRPYIKSNRGNSFVAVDITASQPRLLTTAVRSMLDNEFDFFIYMKRIRKIDITRSITTNLDEIEWNEWKALIDIDINSYKELLIGDFYTNIGSKINLDRDTIKSQFMLYANDYSFSRGRGYELYSFFKSSFPNLHELIEAIKLEDNSIRSNKDYSLRNKKYSIFNKMSILESSIILDTISSSMISKHKDINIFTIHDSIAVEKEYLLDLIDITTKAYNDLDIPLNIKIEDYSSSNIIKDTSIEYIDFISSIKSYYNNIKNNPNNKPYKTILCYPISANDIHNDIQTRQFKIKKINHRGVPHWSYRGTGKQQMIKNANNTSEIEFIKLIEDKFRKGEWV